MIAAAILKLSHAMAHIQRYLAPLLAPHSARRKDRFVWAKQLMHSMHKSNLQTALQTSVPPKHA
jgi:hypothetical protein